VSLGAAMRLHVLVAAITVDLEVVAHQILSTIHYNALAIPKEVVGVQVVQHVSLGAAMKVDVLVAAIAVVDLEVEADTLALALIHSIIPLNVLAKVKAAVGVEMDNHVFPVVRFQIIVHIAATIMLEFRHFHYSY